MIFFLNRPHITFIYRLSITLINNGDSTFFTFIRRLSLSGCILCIMISRMILRYSNPGLYWKVTSSIDRPNIGGWLFLNSYQSWLYDPTVKVAAHWARNSTHSHPCKTEEQTEFHLNDLEVIESGNLESCIRSCYQNIACRGVSYHLEESRCHLKYKMEKK